MWDYEKLKGQLETYLKNTSKEQMIQDLIDADCMKFLEPIEDDTDNTLLK